MVAEPLIGPKLKVWRARRHIHEVEGVLLTFFNGGCYSFVTEHDTERGGYYIRIVVNPLPIDLALAIGDAVHNLRASLDFLATAIIGADASFEKRIHFPFIKQLPELVQSFVTGRNKIFPEDVRRLIIDEIKPYKGGDGEALWALSKLDNLNKHRLLIPVLSVAHISNINAVGDCGSVVTNGYVQATGEINARILGIAGKPTLQNNPDVIFNVLFNDGQFFTGHHVNSTLHALADHVTSVIQAFETLAQRRPPSP